MTKSARRKNLVTLLLDVALSTDALTTDRNRFALLAAQKLNGTKL